MDRALLQKVERQAWFHRYPRGAPIALFVISMLVTLLFVFSFERAASEQRASQLDNDATALVREVQHRFSENIAYLNAGAALFANYDTVSQDDFAQFISDMSESTRERGSLGLGWARWIEPAQVEGFETAQRDALHMPDYTVHPLPEPGGGPMAVITLLEPLTAGNRAAMGYDMYSEPVRRAAIERARVTGRAAVSGRVNLVQDVADPNAGGFLIYVPVLSTRPAMISGPPTELKGFVYSPIRGRDFLASITSRFPGFHGALALYAGKAEMGNQIATTAGWDFANDTRVRSFAMGDQTWTLVLKTEPDAGLSTLSLLTLLFGTVISAGLGASVWFATSRAADDRRVLEWLTQQSAIRTSLTRELNHRVKNTLANVLSIVALTRRRSNGLDDFADGLIGRIRALSATHDLLSERDWKNAPVAEIVRSELAPYLDPSDPHVALSGPEIELTPNDALSLGLALHELATNAAKYGALSTPEGRVAVSWTVLDEQTCSITWQEMNGPPVVAPTRRGFGMDLLEKVVSHELKQPVDVQFDPDGVRCTLLVPIRGQLDFTMRENRR